MVDLTHSRYLNTSGSANRGESVPAPRAGRVSARFSYRASPVKGVLRGKAACERGSALCSRSRTGGLPPKRALWLLSLAREKVTRPYTRMKPLPKISLELVTRIKAWGSVDFRYSRRATAWDRDRAVSTTHFSSWE